ncbi:unnamed protein product [Soboliphyme baturini]|uniref:Acetylcholine receptor subunit alpha-type deg-3 n=1 Tax=Soboliphyme baturini TaxID=241478 RepID=A0A183IBU9_9BILA|nr:unnamed protein product [Soboliphyme baturini]
MVNWRLRDAWSMHLVAMLCLCVESHLVCFPLGCQLAAVQNDTEATSKRLVRDLFENSHYDNRVRPVRHHSTPINDERAQNIELYMWIVQMWFDEFLYWNPKQYEGLENLVIPYNLIWLPDTYLYNGLVMEREKSERWLSVILSMNRSNLLSIDSSNETNKVFVTFRYPAIYKFVCNMNIFYYPFDVQKCRMTFGSWMYDSADINYDTMTSDVFLEEYIENSEWTVESFKAERVVEMYKCCQNPFTLIHADLIIKRKPLFTLVNLVIPTAIINLISLFGFFSPTTTNGERTEKVNLGITTLLAMSILLLMVSEEMPTTSDFIPLIGTRQGRYGKRLSYKWKKFIMKTMANKVGLSLPLSLKDALLMDQENSQEEPVPLGKLDESTMYDSGVHEANHLIEINLYKLKENSKPRNVQNPNSVDSSVMEQLHEIRRRIRHLCESVQDAEEERKLLLEWEFVATVLDRVFLIMFTTLSITTIAGILLMGFLGRQVI